MRNLNVYCQKFNGRAVVVVHSYVEVHMYLLHEFCTKPKLIQTYNILPPKTLEFWDGVIRATLTILLLSC